MTRTYRRSGGLAILVAAAAIGLAACSGGSSSPRVASLGTSSTGNGSGSSTGSGNGSGSSTGSGNGSGSSTGSGNGSGSSTGSSSGSGSSTGTQPKGNPTQLLDEWAACMRRHGDPGQADPTIDANKVIHITWTPSIPGGYNGTNKGGQGNSGPGLYCRAYLGAAQTALRGGQSPPKPPPTAMLLKFSECMRANGIPDFPDPIAGGGIVMNAGAGGDLNPNNPTFQQANNLCVKKTGVQGLPGGGPPPPGTIELNGEALP